MQSELDFFIIIIFYIWPNFVTFEMKSDGKLS